MTYLECAYLKVGDRLTITEEPPLWDFFNSGTLNFPYTFTIKNIAILGEYVDIPHLAIDDTNGYCWSINRRTHHLFEINNNVLNDRKSKINNLNID